MRDIINKFYEFISYCEDCDIYHNPDDIVDEFFKQIEKIPLSNQSIIDITRDIYIESEYQQAYIRFHHLNYDDSAPIVATLRGIDEQQIGTPKYYLHEVQNLYFSLMNKELIDA